VLAAVAVLQGIGVLTALDGFWWPDGEGLRRALAVQAAWAPFPRPVSLLAVLLALVAATALAVHLPGSRRAAVPPARRRPALEGAGLGRPAGARSDALPERSSAAGPRAGSP
jgi:hypothetical protein